MAPPQAADGQAAGHDAEMNQPLLGDSEPPAESEVNTDMRTNGVFQELSELLSLTTAIFIARVSWVIIKTTDSALLGNCVCREICASPQRHPQGIRAGAGGKVRLQDLTQFLSPTHENARLLPHKPPRASCVTHVLELPSVLLRLP